MEIRKSIRNLPLVWRWYYNTRTSSRYLLKRYRLDPDVALVVKQLRLNGIARSSAAELISEDLWNEISSKHFDRTAEMQSDKTYAFFHLNRTYNSNSIYARVAESPAIKAIATHYFRMEEPQLAYYDVWENVPSGEPEKNAQLWHRDRDDLKILKIFVYLNDVKEESGPFYYAPGTHIEGKYANMKPEYFLENNKVERSTDDQMDKIVPREKWISGEGPKGTIVFADTHGYHKGGNVQEGRRLVFVAMYLSPSSGRMRFENLQRIS